MSLPRGILLLIVAWVGSEIGLAIARRSRDPSANALDRSSLRTMWLTITLAVTAAVMLSGRPWGWFGGHWSGWTSIGVALILAGLALRWWAILTLRHSFTVNVAVASGQRVIESGPYAFVRHPSYTGMMISFLGMGLLLRHWTSLIVLLVPITVALLYRIAIEEQALLAGLGDAYADFMRRRRRLVPGIY